MRTSRRLRGVQIFAAVFLQLAPGCTVEVYLQKPAICGNAALDPGERCDDGNTVDGDGCSASCSLEPCGNGSVDGAIGEVCDDGNRVSGDGCSADCKSNETCGNAILDHTVGELCDTGGASATCDPDCTRPDCGDGVLNTAAGEVCDDGNTVSGDGCSASCLSHEECGNGIIDIGELCDEGVRNGIPGAGCSLSCQPAP